jgi:hypothetical protein
MGLGRRLETVQDDPPRAVAVAVRAAALDRRVVR